MEVILEYESSLNEQLKPVVDWNTRLLTEGQFDWADVHLYDDFAHIPAKVAWVRARWAGPLAATEIGGPDSNSGAVYSTAAHVQDLTQRIPAALAAGVERVFWVTLVETPAFGERYNPMALIGADWGRKPAFDAYQEVIAAGGRLRHRCCAKK